MQPRWVAMWGRTRTPPELPRLGHRENRRRCRRDNLINGWKDAGDSEERRTFQTCKVDRGADLTVKGTGERGPVCEVQQLLCLITHEKHVLHESTCVSDHCHFPAYNGQVLAATKQCKPYEQHQLDFAGRGLDIFKSAVTDSINLPVQN